MTDTISKATKLLELREKAKLGDITASCEYGFSLSNHATEICKSFLEMSEKVKELEQDCVTMKEHSALQIENNEFRQKLAASEARVKELESWRSSDQSSIESKDHRIVLLEQKLSAQEREIEKMRDALVSIGEYWNGGRESAYNAIEYATGLANETLEAITKGAEKGESNG